ncbi:hypothetical protein ACFXA3_12255 [Streptomyces sp. NPDC059456]
MIYQHSDGDRQLAVAGGIDGRVRAARTKATVPPTRQVREA